MEESTLKKISYIGAFVGVVLLFIISLTINPNITTIQNLTQEGDFVLRGEITNTGNGNKVTFLTVQQMVPKEVSVLLFYDKNISLKKGDIIQVEGSVEKEEGEYVMVGNKVNLIS